MGELASVKYRAFISYAPADKERAASLQRALEAVRIPWDLVGRETPAGPVPKSLPVFRPAETLIGPPDAATLAALTATQFLVVLCSRDATKSEAVNETVRRFKAMGRSARIIPMIVAGAPGDAEHQFPPALRFKLAPDGTVTEEREELPAPTIIDARPEGDGESRARLKLVAALLGLDSDEMLRRETRRRRRRRLGAVAAVVLVLALGGGAAAWGWSALQQDEALLDRTLGRAGGFAADLAETADGLGAPPNVSLGILENAEGLLRRLAARGPDTPRLRYRKAQVLTELGRNYETRGRSDLARERAMEAQRLLEGIARDAPPAFRREVSLAHDRIGRALAGVPDAAAKSFRASLAILETLGSGDGGLQRDLSIAHNELADALLAQGAAEEALTNYRAALAIRERLAAVEPRNAIAQRDLSVSQERIGDVHLARGEIDEALKSYRSSLALRLAALGGESGAWRRDLAVSYNKVGDALMARHEVADALASYRTGLALHLAAPEPANAAWQRDLSVAHERIGDALLAQRAADAALESFRHSRAIRERLAADPEAARWRRDLPVAHERIGDALLAKGHVGEALNSYRTSLELRRRLVAAEPANAAWQRDLAVSYTKIGDALVPQRELADARVNWRAALTLRERLLAHDPAAAGEQWDTVVLHWRLALHGDDPAGRFAQIVAILRKLAADRKLTPAQARWLPAAEQELAKVQASAK